MLISSLLKGIMNDILNLHTNYLIIWERIMSQEFIINRIKWDRIWISFFISYYGGTSVEKTSIEKTSIEKDSVRENHIKEKSNISVFIKDTAGQHIFELQPGEAENEFKLNITNPGNCKMLPTGIWELVISKDPAASATSINAESTVPAGANFRDIKKFNRQFIYFHNERSYRVQFSDRNGFKIRTSDIVREEIDKKQKLKSTLRRAKNDTAKSILRTIYNTEFLLFHRKPLKKYSGSAQEIQKSSLHDKSLYIRNIQQIKNPHILLMSDQSEEMGSNMAALKKALIREGYKPEEVLRAVTTKHYNILHWIKTLKKIAWADFIFLDDHSQTTDWLTIKGAVITQLWHAGAGFKSTGYSRFGMPASPAPKSGHRQYTYGIAGSKKIRHFFSEVWGINDEMVLPTGMPRLDEYLDQEYIKKTKEKLLKDYPVLCKPDDSDNLEKRDNIILFAPTYRGENKRHAYYPYDKMDMDRLYKLCEETDSVIIFKMHPFVEEPVPIPEEYKDRMIDLVKYPNINDLFYITDLLITDYSSNIYEFSLMRKPMLFYAFDIDEYTKERGFHRDYRTNVPGKIVETFDDMINAINKKDYEYEKVEKYIENNFEFTDTHACERIINWIIRGKCPTDIS